MIIKHQEKIASPEIIQSRFEDLGYICSHSVATAIYLACHLQKPILIDGLVDGDERSISCIGDSVVSYATVYASERRRVMHLMYCSDV